MPRQMPRQGKPAEQRVAHGVAARRRAVLRGGREGADARQHERVGVLHGERGIGFDAHRGALRSRAT